MGVAKFDGAGLQLFPKPYCMIEKRLFGFLVVCQDAPKIKEGHGNEGVAKKNVLEMDHGEETDDRVC